MAIKVQVNQEEFDGLGALQSEYSPVQGQEGLYQITIDPGESGLVLADVSNLQAALNKEKTNARSASNKLKLFDGIDPSQAREALDFKTRFDNGELSDEAKTRLENAEKALVEKYEAQQKQVIDKYESEKALLTKREGNLISELKESKISASVRAAIATHGGNTALLEPLVSSKVELVEEDGKFVVHVLSEDKQPLLSRRPGSTTEPMSINEFVEGLKNTKEFSPAFNGTGSSGAGSNSNSGTGNQGSGGQFTLTEEQAKNTADYRRMKAAAEKAGQKLVIVGS